MLIVRNTAFVISGISHCLIEDVPHTIHTSESLDVPIGAKHRIANDGDKLLVVIDIQRGAYTGEADIPPR